MHELVTLGLELVVCTTSLKQRLVDTTTASDDTNGRTAAAGDGLLRAGRETDTGLVLIWRVADDSRVVAGRAGKRAAVACLLLDVADDGTFGQLGNRDNVANSELSLLSTVNEGTSVKTLGRNESLLAELVAVGVPEDNTGKGGSTTRSSALSHTSHECSTHRPESWMISFTMPLM